MKFGMMMPTSGALASGPGALGAQLTIAQKAEALGTSLNQMIRDYLQKLAGGDDPEKSIEEFKRLSGQGNSRGWKFNRNEIHARS